MMHGLRENIYFRHGKNISENAYTTKENKHQYTEIMTDRKFEVESTLANLNRNKEAGTN